MATLKDRLVEAANRVWKAFLKWGPVDDGRPEGDEFDEALMELRQAAKRTRHQTSKERAALVDIVNALNANPEPCHFAIREAINRGNEVLADSDLIVDDE